MFKKLRLQCQFVKKMAFSPSTDKIDGMIRLIAALGNPGSEYAHTRHNAAWVMMDVWSAAHPTLPWKVDREYNAFRSEAVLGENRVWLLKPLTFMNLSGEAIRAFTWFYKIQPEELLVIHDEVAFDVGQMRLSFGGSSGGHNGMESIIQALGARELWRLRLGMGPRMPDLTLTEWVLGPLGDEAEKWLKSEKTLETIDMIIKDGPETAQGKIN